MAKDKYDVCLTTYQALLMIPEIMKTSWHFCIFDEAHKLKISESESAIQARKL
jgi:SNF2 family DNA or RNA helicase